MEVCSRCGKPFAPGEHIVADPCCLAPDCDNVTARSHFDCLPPQLQLEELEMQLASRIIREGL